MFEPTKRESEISRPLETTQKSFDCSGLISSTRAGVCSAELLPDARDVSTIEFTA
jgi:hypothetical protein